MRKKLFCMLLALACAWQLGACALMDEEYVSIRDYVPSVQEESSTGGRLTVHSASGITSALLGMVYEGRTEGSIVFDAAYDGDAAEDLEAACWTVRTEDALCAYCVENISYDFNKIVTVNEASIRIRYSKASENPLNVIHLGFSSEAEGVILNAMEKGEKTLTLLVSRSGFTADEMAAQVVKIYRSNPTVVPKKPRAIVNVFNGAGMQCLYEIQIDYGVTMAQLIRCRRQLADFAPFAELDVGALNEVERAYTACRYLLENCTVLDSGEENSAYAALIEGKADSEGLALGYVELCRQLGVDCRIVYGQLDWQEHCWNIVRIDDSYYHVDVAQCASGGPAVGFMKNDEAFWGAYRWDVGTYPKCTGQSSFFDFFPPSMFETGTEAGGA